AAAGTTGRRLKAAFWERGASGGAPSLDFLQIAVGSSPTRVRRQDFHKADTCRVVGRRGFFGEEGDTVNEHPAVAFWQHSGPHRTRWASAWAPELQTRF